MNNRTVLITGASSGIGFAAARKFAQQNYKLILLARQEDKLIYAKENLSTPTYIIKTDISDLTSLRHQLENLPAEFKDIDVLVNNAGVTLGEGPIEDRNIADLEKMVSVNINGLLYCTQIILPLMVKRNSGHIINIGSTAGTYPRPGNPLYCASKAFSKQFSLALRADLTGKKIRVTSIEPGTVKGTDLALGRVGGDRARLNALYEGYEYLNPEDVAETIFWAASLPEHVNINRIDVMATCQSFSNLTNVRA
ncbi:SDR family NAD(P)-dependent oxidoreductase [Legionella erythra]|uniref:Short chain dehydrogenase/reductase family oxidoreductase n=1 Tax=Legionella erythra TaxID=448 RepID=A0A0W0TTI5_LEGER|nr:SDR family NAD(P)-dependent oxidoreductase [Legionella erythra]KTC98715.1 short chain dehydrogenase/reductase family oxidoreductase [Legionella erythra]